MTGMAYLAIRQESVKIPIHDHMILQPRRNSSVLVGELESKMTQSIQTGYRMLLTDFVPLVHRGTTASTMLDDIIPGKNEREMWSKWTRMAGEYQKTDKKRR